MKYLKYLNKYPNLNGKVYLITGANSGLGFELARHLYYLGASLIFACRNKEKAHEAKKKIYNEFGVIGEIFVEEYDQASFESIDRFCEILLERYDINGLVANAGVYFPKQGAKTKDNLELTVGTNYFGTFRLIQNLKQYLKNKKVKIVIVTSLTAFLSKYIELEKFEKLSRNKLYGYSKLLLAKYAYELSIKGYNVSLVHPGVCSTNILFNKDTGLSSSFARAGRKFLNIFTHSATKASFTLLSGLKYKNCSLMYHKPRGLFAISGYPIIRKIPKKYYSKGLIEKTYKIIGGSESVINK